MRLRDHGMVEVEAHWKRVSDFLRNCIGTFTTQRHQDLRYVPSSMQVLVLAHKHCSPTSRIYCFAHDDVKQRFWNAFGIPYTICHSIVHACRICLSGYRLPSARSQHFVHRKHA